MKISIKDLKRRARLLKKHSAGKSFWVFVISVFVMAVSITVFYTAFLLVKLPSPGNLQTTKINQSTKIFDKTGEVQLFEAYGEEKRTIIPFSEMPEQVKKATLAAEDANFYNQPAFNWKSIARALITNLREGRVVQGGSTISQQLAKNVFLSPERTITRKLKELILAIELEIKYTKDQILEMYLNQIPYGSNAYGIEAASQTFFKKSPKELTLNEAATLASMPKAPSYYSPWGPNEKALLERRKYVLDRMLEFGFINKDEHKKAYAEKVMFQAKPAEIKAYHFALMVRDYLKKKYGDDVVEKGGLKVKTTLDWRLQEIAERAVKEGATRNSELYNGRNAALVAQDPRTGQILAWVGSKDFAGEPEPEGCEPGASCKFESDFNVPLQGLRQPGSALKPFAYLTVFERGYGPQTILFDAPTEFAAGDSECPARVDFNNENDKCFHPQNFSNMFEGPMSMARGLAQSVNVTAVKALYLAGMDNVLETLKNFGVTTLNQKSRYGLTLVLGGGEVRLTELVNAYATLSQEGVFHKQSMILEVKDAGGKILESYKDDAKRVMGPQSPRLINQVLSDTSLREGLLHANLGLTVFPGYEVALKTGTTEDYRDAWAAGYTPSLAFAIWAGNNDSTPMERKGGSILAAIPIWSAFLKEALQYFPQESFERPDTSFVSSKPMINGNYIYNPSLGGVSYPQIHSILHYVRRSDPLGAMPGDPYNDPQYVNWEAGVAEWAAQNVSGYSSLYNRPVPTGAEEVFSVPGRGIKISNLMPANGSYVKSPFVVSANINSNNPLKRAELYFNQRLVTSAAIAGTSHRFNWYVFDRPESQNTLVIKVIDEKGNEVSEDVVVYN